MHQVNLSYDRKIVRVDGCPIVVKLVAEYYHVPTQRVTSGLRSKFGMIKQCWENQVVRMGQRLGLI